VATISNAVFVLHCFEKKTRQTPKSDIDLAKQRYRLAIESFRAKEQA
jgi:phage-related protein